jgi:hypothetical protein
MSTPDASPPRRRRRLALAAAAGAGLLVLAGLAFEALATAPTRGAVRAYTQLIAAANRGDLAGVRRLCSRRFAASHAFRLADEGGVVGFPRGIHKNFRAWTRGRDVWLCPTNRVGPVYRFVEEAGAWRFDGPVGYLRPGNRFIPADEAAPG